MLVFMATIAKRDAIGDIEAQGRITRPRFDVVGAEVMTARITALLTGEVVAVVDGEPPAIYRPISSAREIAVTRPVSRALIGRADRSAVAQ